MKRTFVFLMLLATGILAFSQTNNSSDQEKKKSQKETGSDKNPVKDNSTNPDTLNAEHENSDTKYTEGASGVKRSIAYKFSSLVEDDDPGTGIFRYDDKAISRVRYIFINKNDFKGEDQTNWYETWDDTTGASGRGQLTMVEHDGDNVNIFDVTDVFIQSSGYWKIPVDYVSGNLPDNDSVYYFIFHRIAHSENGNGNQKDNDNREDQADRQEQQDNANQGEQADSVAQNNQQNEDSREDQADRQEQQDNANQGEQADSVAQNNQQNQDNHEGQADRQEQQDNVNQGEQADSIAQNNQGKQNIQENFDNQARESITKKITQVDLGKESNNRGQQNQGNQRTQENANPTQADRNAQRTVTLPSNQGYYGNQYTYNQTRTNTGNSGGVHKKCYRGIIEAGFGLGTGDYGMNDFRFNFINGFRIGPCISIGLGIGVRRYFDATDDPGWYLVSSNIQIPVFLDIRTTFSTKKLTPYLALGIGNSAGYSASGTTQEGSYYSGSGGIWYNVSDRFAVFLGIAYDTQKLEFSDTNPFTNNYKKNSGTLSLNVGIAF